MKKLMILGFLSLGIVFLAGCGQLQNTNQQVTQPQNTIYTNSEYGFTLIFPETWGTIEEKKSENGGKIHASIILVSANDSARFIKIQVVKNEDKNDPAVIDYPQKYITENSTYIYYYTGAGCCVGYPGTEEIDLEIQKEVEAIIKTFTLEESQDIVYTNSEYGFTLTLPSTWEDYTTQLGPKADGKAGTSDSVAFSLPDQTKLFVIKIYPETVWNDIQQAEGPTPTYLAKNNEYIFGSSMTQDAANETMVARIAEIKDILKTFKFSNTISTEPLSYSITGVSAFVSKETASFGYTADQLVSLAQECGNEQTESYFSDLISKFNGTTKTVYNFKYTGAGQGTDIFIVTLLPNKIGYSSLDEFKKDFDQC